MVFVRDKWEAVIMSWPTGNEILLMMYIDGNFTHDVIQRNNIYNRNKLAADFWKPYIRHALNAKMTQNSNFDAQWRTQESNVKPTSTQNYRIKHHQKFCPSWYLLTNLKGIFHWAGLRAQFISFITISVGNPTATKGAFLTAMTAHSIHVEI